MLATCTYPESFVGGGYNFLGFFLFFYEGRDDTTISGPLSARLNGVSLMD